MRAQFVTSEIAIGLRRNLTMTVAVVLVTALSLGLVGAALLFGKQVNHMKGYWYDKAEVTVYLCIANDPTPSCNNQPSTPDQKAQINSTLQQSTAVKKVTYESQAEAFIEFKKLFADEPDIVRNVDANALPDSYRIKLKNPKQVDIVASEVVGLPGVSEVKDEKKALEPIFKLINSGQVVALIIGGIALIATVLLTFQTIRVAAFSRRRETGIMRLVGASNLYIRLPFLLEGAIAGLLGAGFACLGLVGLKILMVDDVLRPTIKFTPFISMGDVIAVFPIVIGISLVVSVGSSFLAIQRHLRV